MAKTMPDENTYENSYYERLIQLREENPRAFAVLSPVEKTTLAYYEAEKRRRSALLAQVTVDEDDLPPAA